MTVGKIFMVFGGVVFVVGVLLWALPYIPGGSRLFRLPGDIHIKGSGFSFHFPWLTCLLLSLGASFVVYLTRRLFK